MNNLNWFFILLSFIYLGCKGSVSNKYERPYLNVLLNDFDYKYYKNFDIILDIKNGHQNVKILKDSVVIYPCYLVLDDSSSVHVVYFEDELTWNYQDYYLTKFGYMSVFYEKDPEINQFSRKIVYYLEDRNLQFSYIYSYNLEQLNEIDINYKSGLNFNYIDMSENIYIYQPSELLDTLNISRLYPGLENSDNY